MGYFSDLAIEQNENHLTGLDKMICINCVQDKYLAKLVLENAKSNRCSYCKKKFRSNKATTYNFIMKVIYQAIFKYYADAQDLSLPHDEGEWVVESKSLEDIFFQFNPGWDDVFSSDLLNSADPFLYLVPHSNNDWLEFPESEALKWSWDSFKDQILYKTRYLFLNEPIDEFGDRQIIPVSMMLNVLATICTEFNLITKIPKGNLFYRVRINTIDQSFDKFEEMGVAPQKIASAGRMNPSGIPYFYIANTPNTAMLEVIKDNEHWHCAKFELTKDIDVIDFSNLPEIPSIFDHAKYKYRQQIIFLHDLVEDMSKPILENTQDQIDYIPTQVVSEFFRHRFKPEIKGIKYKSVKSPKGLNIAFFESVNENLKEYFNLIDIKKGSANP